MAERVKCRQGHDNQPGSNFCRICGEKIGGGRIDCRFCGAAIDSGSHFCPACGKSQSDDKAAELKGMRWQRGYDDFATRVDVEDMEGTLKKGIIIEQGTKALLLINGALAETLLPGKYDMGGLKSRLASFDLSRTSTALLVDAGDVELNMNITGIFTRDPLNIDVACRVIARIEDPALFLNNVLKGKKSYAISELRNALYDEMHNAFNEVIGKKSVEELSWDLSLKRQFEVAVENHLRTTFQRSGLNFVQLRTIDYTYEGFDKVRGILEKTYLQVSEEEAELQKRKRLFDVYDRGQLQELVEEAKEVEHLEKRQKVRADMLQLLSSEAMNKVKSEDDLEAYIHEMNKGKALRDEEVRDLLNAFAQSGLKRDFLIEKIKLEQQLEAERIGLVGHKENELAEWEIEARKRRRILEEQMGIKAAERQTRVEDARTGAEIKDLEREADEKDLEMGLKGLRGVKEIKAKEKRDEMEIETERLKRLSEIGIEALISASDKEKAAMLKELRETEILKGMTEEQILAMGAQRSDELAKAFQEKFRGLSAERQEELYREMMAQKDKSMEVMQEMFNKALETQRDASVGVAQGGKVVYPPPGGLGISQVGGDVVVCPKCKTRVAVTTGMRFCNNCGHEIL